ncbi:MAG: phage major capsid protein [Desulfomicrobium sp.]|nr:phage major capsid protein [Desulfomicrobium sp.]
MAFDEVKNLLEKQHEAFKSFEKVNLARHEKHAAEIDRLEKEIDDFVKKGRPGRSDSGDDSQKMKSFVEFVREGDQGVFTTESKAISIVDGADIAVPSVIDSRVEDLALPFSPMRRVSRVVRDGTGDFTLLVNTRGLVVGRVGEKDARPETGAPGLEEIKPVVGELYANPAITQKAIDDIFFNAATWLSTEIAEAFGVAENEDFISGNGTNRAKGILTYTTTAEADGVRDFGKIQHCQTASKSDPPSASNFDPLRACL